MVVDVENVLVEFHHTPTASEGECCERLLRELRSDFGDEVQCLSMSGYTCGIPGAIQNWFLRIKDYFYVAGQRRNYGPVSVHALFGGDHLSESALGFSASKDGFAGYCQVEAVAGALFQ